ncbi:MAG: FAD-dependent oxidoreductase [Pseudomonadota bacterium]
MHKYAVVGRGLIGSAAARHLAEETDGVLCIGADEPKSRAAHAGVFGSHYDEGRMTRFVDPVAEWSITAGQSIRRYRDIEDRSGINFYDPAGYLGLGYPNSTYNARCAATGAAHGAEIEHLDTNDVRRRFAFLNVEDGVDGLVETGGAGYISPRNMVRAQSVLAEKAGATLMRQAARGIRSVSGGVEIELWDGSIARAEKVLVTAGAFTQACGLCPVDLGVFVYGRTTVLAKIAHDAEQELRGMPTMIDTLIGAYILPPIRYPDGHLYLKLGVGDVSDPRFSDLDGLRGWFQSDGSAKDRQTFTARMKALFPVLETCRDWHTDTCAVTFTQNLLPIIDFVHEDKIAVAVGGCGKGAKGSDEWGRIAAGIIRNAPWSSSVDPAKLALRRETGVSTMQG